MSILRPFRAIDLFRFNNINLDIWTETYSISFYLTYLARWPDLCCTIQSHNGTLMGYALGKAEGVQREWHGHVTAITVAPHFRRLGLATKMMDFIELVSEKVHNGYFVDLYVRCTNEIAIYMYERMGYSVYRRVRDYYSFSSYVESNGQNAADAYDMRKPLPRDIGKRSIRANGRDIVVSAESVS